MAGPNSVPNGDTRLMMGHVNTEYRCDTHRVCTQDSESCRVITLREWLLKRNRLVTGKSRG